MPIKAPLSLYRNRHGIFYFRLLIPGDLCGYVSRAEFRFSLHTEQRHQAIIASHQIKAALPDLFANLRLMSENNAPLPTDFFQRWLQEKRRTITLSYQIEELQFKLKEAESRLSASVSLKHAAQVVKTAYTSGQLKGKQEIEARLVFPPSPEHTAPFSVLKAAYLKGLTVRPEGGRKRPPTQSTLDDYDKSLRIFIRIMGDLNIGAIDKDIAGEYFRLLRQLPANINKRPCYRGKTIQEILAMGEPPQSESNASKHMERTSTMFKWALGEKRKWGIDANPFMGFGQADSTNTVRRPFTHDELHALLQHPNFVQRRFRNSYSFWLIPLAIYTGARLGELCQLDLRDFVDIDGIPCIDINDIDSEGSINERGSGKRVKTSNAKRLVPLHRELIRIGILRHVERLKKQGNSPHLFPELSRKHKKGPAHAASNWFQRFRQRAGVTTKQETVFHSFRHLFITNIVDSGTPPHMLAPIVGHEAELITGKVYWNKKDAAKRQPTIEAFSLTDDIKNMIPTIDEITIKPGASTTM